MKSSYYLRNNVTLAIGVVYSILHTRKTVSLAELSLLFPFLFDEKVVDTLLDRNKFISIGNLITMNKIALANFNDRYLSLLPLVYQSLSMMLDIEAITISEGVVIPKNLQIFEEMMPESQSEHLSKICNASIYLVHMFEHVKLAELYKFLKIEL